MGSPSSGAVVEESGQQDVLGVLPERWGCCVTKEDNLSAVPTTSCRTTERRERMGNQSSKEKRLFPSTMRRGRPNIIKLLRLKEDRVLNTSKKRIRDTQCRVRDLK